jgi:predicted enzyme related to lactoylglutathione lyase
MADDRHGALAWWEIHVDDIDAAAEFYSTVFGWSYQPLTGFELGKYLMIITKAGNSAGGALAQATGRQRPASESTVAYLQVDDIPGTVDAVLAAGGSLHRPYLDIGGDHGFCAIVRDPAGNHLGLWSDH